MLTRAAHVELDFVQNERRLSVQTYVEAELQHPGAISRSPSSTRSSAFERRRHSSVIENIARALTSRRFRCANVYCRAGCRFGKRRAQKGRPKPPLAPLAGPVQIAASSSSVMPANWPRRARVCSFCQSSRSSAGPRHSGHTWTSRARTFAALPHADGQRSCGARPRPRSQGHYLRRGKTR
jgi:hypothetical protein